MLCLNRHDVANKMVVGYCRHTYIIFACAKLSSRPPRISHIKLTGTSDDKPYSSSSALSRHYIYRASARQYIKCFLHIRCLAQELFVAEISKLEYRLAKAKR